MIEFPVVSIVNGIKIRRYSSAIVILSKPASLKTSEIESGYAFVKWT